MLDRIAAIIQLIITANDNDLMQIVASYILNNAAGVNENNGIIPGCQYGRDWNNVLSDKKEYEVALKAHLTTGMGELY